MIREWQKRLVLRIFTSSNNNQSISAGFDLRISSSTRCLVTKKIDKRCKYIVFHELTFYWFAYLLYAKNVLQLS